MRENEVKKFFTLGPYSRCLLSLRSWFFVTRTDFDVGKGCVGGLLHLEKRIVLYS